MSDTYKELCLSVQRAYESSEDLSSKNQSQTKPSMPTEAHLYLYIKVQSAEPLRVPSLVS